MLSIAVARTIEELEDTTSIDSFAEKLHEMLMPYNDSVKEIKSGIHYALDTSGHRGGFVLIALNNGETVGALVMLNTNMAGYVPENLLLYVAVHESQRGKGTGTKLIEKAIDLCEGNVKLHVEYDNPAKRLYERIGFVSRYADMRYSNE